MFLSIPLVKYIKRYAETTVYGLAPLSCLVILLAASTGLCSDDLKITRDKQGTTWSVGSEESREKARAEEERDKDRAWDMLKNSSIIFDKREQK